MTKRQVKLAAIVRRVVKTAKMDDANFGNDVIIVNGVKMDADDYIKGRIRLWLSTWIIGPLEDVEDVLEGKAKVRDVEFWAD